MPVITGKNIFYADGIFTSVKICDSKEASDSKETIIKTVTFKSEHTMLNSNSEMCNVFANKSIKIKEICNASLIKCDYEFAIDGELYSFALAAATYNSKVTLEIEKENDNDNDNDNNNNFKIVGITLHNQ